MKVLLGTHRFFPKYKTGTEVLTSNMAKELTQKGYEVAILTSEPVIGNSGPVDIPSLIREDYDGVEVYRIFYDSSKLSNVVEADYMNQVHESLVEGLIDDLRPDVVHLNHAAGLSLGIIKVIKRHNIPIVFTATDFWSICPKVQLYRERDGKRCQGPESDATNCLQCLRPISRLSAKTAINLTTKLSYKLMKQSRLLYSLKKRVQKMMELLNEVDIITAPTTFTKKMLVAHGVKENKLVVIPFGVDFTDDEQKRVINQPDAHPLQMGFIGSLINIKGPHVAIDAYKSLDVTKDKAILHIYGAGDVNSEYYNRLIESAMPCEGIIFEGTFPSSKMGEVLSKLDVLIVPSIWYENMPLVLCSALSSKTPVVVSNLEGLTEVVTEGIDGFYFEPGDSKSLSEVLIRFLNDPSLADQLAMKMNKMFKTTQEYVNECIGLYTKLSPIKPEVIL